ncbi:hypothetical protein M422DRAFT_169954 [Sphaerobolus stellatus SS14]|uniref:Unplaced genomic scaffold SPHSTscaffold_48, whole genome shotgun sequence n=1 Tax=Sphaerobolus stellatus (strain SS14) TaxID=990650 RepID=A0A0C9VX42_SPHS4|nr:hypothetical protein M422DRAFT_169954 [Sphaerobolus stellatus SS14]
MLDLSLVSPALFTGYCLCFFFLVKSRLQASDGRRLPGPTGLPFIGNALDIKEEPWLLFESWRKRYGNIVSYNVLGQKYVLVASLEYARELFEKRATNYSSRPRLVMLCELCGWDFSFAALPYGLRWRRHRKVFHQYFNSGVVAKYKPIHNKEKVVFLQRLLESPENLMGHIRHSFASTILDIVYGYKVAEKADPLIHAVDQTMDGFCKTAFRGAFLVDIFPILKYVPSWMPGAEFKRLARYWKNSTETMINTPYEAVKAQLDNGTAGPSVAAALIENMPPVESPTFREEEEIRRNAAGIAFAAGADTTISSIYTFFAAMAMHPHIQKKAQEELDRVVGSTRLPDFNDKVSLPYVEALIKECLRWQNVLPLGFARASEEDDIVDGFFIGKGTVLIQCTWSITHDPKHYPSPHEFKPDRFLDDGGQFDRAVLDPFCVVFGIGRRICPGRHLADQSLFSIISSVLAVFDITLPLDKDGKPCKLECEMTSGAISYPKPFQCIIRPRSPAAEILIRDH